MHFLFSAHVSSYKCENLIKKFVSNVRFVNVLNIAHKHPQAYWNLYPLLIIDFNLGL